MKFKKYPSLQNHYREKQIGKWVSYSPELLNEKYIITEKIHGSNFQIIINQDSVEFASRNRILQENDSFFGYQEVMERYTTLIDKLQCMAVNEDIKCVRVFGELFGAGIQKGVYYGDEKQFKIFDIYIDEDLLTQADTLLLLEQLELDGYFVPIISIVDGLDAALSINSEFNTKLCSDLDNNICEGVVIKPYDKIYSYDDSIFYIKKKNESFTERQKGRKNITNKQSSEYIKLESIFKEYINNNRVESAFSKMGEIERPEQIGEYIKVISEDAKDDFLKDNHKSLAKLSDKEQNSLFRSGSKKIALILKSYL